MVVREYAREQEVHGRGQLEGDEERRGHVGDLRCKILVELLAFGLGHRHCGMRGGGMEVHISSSGARAFL